MKNVYDIRKERNLYFILSEKIKTSSHIKCSSAVIIFLYYKESLNRYLTYIDHIVSSIDIYIVSNNLNIYGDISRYIQRSRKQIQLIRSKNRGRDVSALLIECVDILQKYKYICFVHDKKRKDYISEDAFELWMDNLWGNTLGSKVYISNILHLLESRKEIGLLVPPEPIGLFSPFLYGDNVWGMDFELTQQLAKELNLECRIDADRQPITLGMCFWARSCALEKLFKKKWVYDDFEKEPLKDDGTISHAIERILGYVVQDAGYLTGTIMRVSYAEKTLALKEEQVFTMCLLLKKAYGINDVESFLEKKDLIQRFYKKNKQVYLYGAGKVGQNCMQLMQAIGCEPTGYIVTEKTEFIDRIEGVSVKSIYEIEDIEKVGIIITVSTLYQDEIEKTLKAIGIKNYIKY